MLPLRSRITGSREVPICFVSIFARSTNAWPRLKIDWSVIDDRGPVADARNIFQRSPGAG